VVNDVVHALLLLLGRIRIHDSMGTPPALRRIMLRTEKGSDRRTWSCGSDGGCGGVLHGDHNEAVLRWLVGWEEVAEHPLHRLHRLCGNSLGRRLAITPPLSPHFAPLCSLRRLASHRSGERKARSEPGCLARRWPLARLPDVMLVSSPMASRSGENGSLQIGRERQPPDRKRMREEREGERERE
jgi:hypothetical protein